MMATLALNGLTIYEKSFFLDVWQDSKYASKMKPFAKIDNGSKPLIIYKTSFILDV